MDSGDYTCFKLSFAKSGFHFAAYRLPFLVARPPVYAPVSNDLDITVSEEQIDQDTVIVLGIPYAQLRKTSSPRSRADWPRRRGSVFNEASTAKRISPS